MSAHGKLLGQSSTLAERRAELAFHGTLTSTRRNLSWDYHCEQHHLNVRVDKPSWFYSISKTPSKSI